jgi:hypothetical protein
MQSRSPAWQRGPLRCRHLSSTRLRTEISVEYETWQVRPGSSAHKHIYPLPTRHSSYCTPLLSGSNDIVLDHLNLLRPSMPSLLRLLLALPLQVSLSPSIPHAAAFFISHLKMVEHDVRDGKLKVPPLPSRGGPHGQQYSQQQQGMGQQQPQQQYATQIPGGYLPAGQPGGPPLLIDPSSLPPGAIIIPAGSLPPQLAFPGTQPPVFMAPQDQQQQQYQAPGLPANGYGPAGAAPMVAAASLAPVQRPQSFAVEHSQWGVRVGEFHQLSPFAVYVQPAAALRLQQLWDGGNKLVSLLDDT